MEINLNNQRLNTGNSPLLNSQKQNPASLKTNNILQKSSEGSSLELIQTPNNLEARIEYLEKTLTSMIQTVTRLTKLLTSVLTKLIPSLTQNNETNNLKQVAEQPISKISDSSTGQVEIKKPTEPTKKETTSQIKPRAEVNTKETIKQIKTDSPPPLNVRDSLTSGALYDIAKNGTIFAAGHVASAFRAGARYGMAAARGILAVGGTIIATPVIITGAAMAGAGAILTQTETGKSALNTINDYIDIGAKKLAMLSKVL